MKEAGGIIALIAGTFGVTGAATTLFVGGVGGVFTVEGTGTVIGLGWGGVLFSFLTIIFGAMAIGAEGKVPGILLIISSILGAILGCTRVATCMVPALCGGILAIFGKKKVQREVAA